MTAPRIVFFVPYGCWLVHTQPDAVVALTASLKGAEVVLVRCDGLFVDGCYVLAYHDNPAEGCAFCQRAGTQFFANFNLPTVQLRSYLAEEDFGCANKLVEQIPTEQLPAFRYEGTALGEVSSGSVCSYYRVSMDELSNPTPAALLRKYIGYSILTYRGLTRLFDQFKPTHLFLYNGVGFSYGAALELAKKRRISAITHERGAHDGSYMIASDIEAGSAKAVYEVYKAWKSVPLNESELLRTQEFFRNREAGKDMNSSKFYGYTSESNSVRARLNIPTGKRFLVVYTSSEYELAYYGSEYLQALHQLEIIEKLFQVFRNRDEYLVIRHHPAIGLMPGGGKPQGKMLRKLYQQTLDLPPNVRVIMPNERITSYALMWNSDATIGFLSTTRLEACARGQPSASINHPFISAGLTDTIEGESVEDLSRLVDSLFARYERFGPTELQNLYRATYACNFRHSVKFSTFSFQNASEININIESADSLERDESLMRVIRHIFNGTSIYPLPSDTRSRASDEAEMRFLSSEAAAIREKRAHILATELPLGEPTPVSGFLLDRCASPRSLASLTLAGQRSISMQLSSIENYHEPAQVLSRVQSCRDEFLVITSPFFLYDASWLSTLINKLKEQPTANGCLSGAWIQTSATRVDGAYFFKGDRVNLAPVAVHPESFSDSPLFLLGLGVFRRSLIEKLLSDACQRHGYTEIAALVSETLNDASVVTYDEPSMVICTPIAHQSYLSTDSPLVDVATPTTFKFQDLLTSR